MPWWCKCISSGLSLLIVALAWIYSGHPLTAAESAIHIPNVDRAPKLQTFLHGVPREDHTIITDFRQRKPYDGHPVSSATNAYLSYDSHNLYVVFVCSANRESLRAHLSRRDDLADDETVSISVDTFHDGRHAYMFFVNPLGVQMDGLITEGQEDDFSFDAIWHSEGRLTAKGYVVLIAIPFKSLRFTRGGAETWGISLSRYIPDRQELPHFRTSAAIERDTSSSLRR